jgi:hypothetical protein
MKRILISLAVLLASFAMMLLALPQSAKDDIKDAGSDVKKAGVATGNATVKAGQATGKGTVKVVKKTGSVTKKTTKKVVHASADAVGNTADKVSDKTADKK